jgi:ABC-type nitrate/sulfonate/bicarbonate transport system permease component
MAMTKRLAGIVLALLVWAGLARSGLVPAEYFPPPLTVAAAGWALLVSSDFPAQIATTCLRMIAGLLVATGLGLAVAIMTGRYQLLYRMLEPVVGMLRVLPPPAIVPISIFAFGIGPGLFLFIIAFASFWPIYMNAANALQASEPVQLLTGRSLGYSRWEILLRLRLPAALPEIVTGIRVGAGIALLATVAAEMLAGQSGLGFLLYDAAFTLRTADMFAIMVVIGVLGLLFNALVRQASRLVIGWHLAMTALGGSA